MLDLWDGQRDHARVGWGWLVWPRRWWCLGIGAVAQQGGGDGADRQGGHDQHGVAGDRGVEANLRLIQAEAVLEVDDTLQDYSHRLPSEVEITNPRHPMADGHVP